MREFHCNKYSNLLFYFMLDNELMWTNCMKICPPLRPPATRQSLMKFLQYYHQPQIGPKNRNTGWYVHRSNIQVLKSLRSLTITRYISSIFYIFKRTESPEEIWTCVLCSGAARPSKLSRASCFIPVGICPNVNSSGRPPWPIHLKIKQPFLPSHPNQPRAPSLSCMTFLPSIIYC